MQIAHFVARREGGTPHHIIIERGRRENRYRVTTIPIGSIQDAKRTWIRFDTFNAYGDLSFSRTPTRVTFAADGDSINVDVALLERLGIVQIKGEDEEEATGTVYAAMEPTTFVIVVLVIVVGYFLADDALEVFDKWLNGEAKVESADGGGANYEGDSNRSNDDDDGDDDGGGEDPNTGGEPGGGIVGETN